VGSTFSTGCGCFFMGRTFQSCKSQKKTDDNSPNTSRRPSEKEEATRLCAFGVGNGAGTLQSDRNRDSLADAEGFVELLNQRGKDGRIARSDLSLLQWQRDLEHIRRR